MPTDLWSRSKNSLNFWQTGEESSIPQLYLTSHRASCNLLKKNPCNPIYELVVLRFNPLCYSLLTQDFTDVAHRQYFMGLVLFTLLVEHLFAKSDFSEVRFLIED